MTAAQGEREQINATRRKTQMADKPMDVYLNDHLAGGHAWE